MKHTKYIQSKTKSKTILGLALCFILSLSLTSCEEVIDVNLTTAPPRLVIDASLNWENDTDGSYQTIRLSTTTGFFDPNIPSVSGAEVTVRKGDNLFVFIEDEQNPGLYECFDFDAEIDAFYELRVLINGQEYRATEQMMDVPNILFVEQGIFTGFGAESFEFRFFFQDNPDEDNFYMSEFRVPSRPLPEYSVFNDRFTQGNVMFDLIVEDEVEAGDVVFFRLFGISRDFFEYMRKLLSISNQGGGGSPFDTPPATVRGNIINQTDFNNFAFGYFRLSKTYSLEYTVQEMQP